MPQLLSPSLRLLFPLPSSLSRLCALGRRNRGGAFFTHKRAKSDGALREDKRKELGGVEMVKEKEEFLFNEGRAKGNDKGLRGRSMELKARKANPVSTTSHVQILGTGMDTQDTSPSILLFFDQQRFLFNAGEGLQRFCSEHKIKLSKIDHIFLSRVCSETAGGIPGLLLTLAGLGDEGMSVNIWGPSDLEFLLGAMRGFIPRKAMLHAHSFGGQSDAATSSPDPSPIVLIDNEVVRISAMFVRPVSPKPDKESNLKPGETAVVYACELPEIQGKFDPVKAASLGLRPGPKYRHLQLGQSVKSDSLDITVNPSDVLGPPTPGPIILLVDCPTVGHTEELFNLPSFDRYTKGRTEQSGRVVNCVIHLGPTRVTDCVAYRDWMAQFGGAQHIMAGHATKNMEIPILQASARISSRLNYLCPQFFPASGFWPNNDNNKIKMDQNMDSDEIISANNLLKFNLRPISQLGLDKSAVPITLSHKNIIRELFAEIPEIKDISQQISKLWQTPTSTNLTLPPTEKATTDPYLNKCNSINNNNNSNINNNNNLIEKRSLDINENSSPPLEGGLKKRLRDNLETPIIPSCLEKITREEMEITLLGTGSSQPSKYRNVSSIYINLFNKGSILLDCGEGSLGQLKRRFGVEGADEAVKNLKLIWVSHIHADHHTGLVRILALRYQLLKLIPHEPLLVIGPSPLQRFLNAYADLEELNFQFLDCRQTLKSGKEALNASGALSNLFRQGSKMESIKRKPMSSNSSEGLDKLKEVLVDAGLEDLYSVTVRHCPEAFGLVLQSRDRVSRIGKWFPGWKLVYSGDTRPCPALIEAAKDATVLIHEATFEDSMTEEAIAKNHSTTKEAIQVGDAAGAYRVILTHFSQRYPKIPVLDEVDTDKTCIAFDLMSVNLADLPVLPKVLPYLKCLFKDEMAVDESDEDEVQESVLY
ncbi:hypothetical protein LUZ60_010010 [Juncus effusus]|nr:hypothetical protein LUZ60_010010 [Juncus effusus]